MIQKINNNFLMVPMLQNSECGLNVSLYTLNIFYFIYIENYKHILFYLLF